MEALAHQMQEKERIIDVTNISETLTEKEKFGIPP